MDQAQFQAIMLEQMGKLNQLESMDTNIKSIKGTLDSLSAQVGALQTDVDDLKRFRDEIKARMDALEAQQAPTQRPGAAPRQVRRRMVSADPGEHEPNDTLVIKGFPFAMWRARLIELAKGVCADRIPSHHNVSYQATDNTKLVKLEFGSNAEAKAFYDSTVDNKLEIQIGQEMHKLKVQWERVRPTRMRGWLLSQLWHTLEQAFPLRQNWLRASAIRGELTAELDDTGRVLTLFKFIGEADSPTPVLESLQLLNINEEAATAMIADAMAKRLQR